MNWGKGIAIFIISFMIFIGTFVYRAFQVKVPLVAENYYQQEISFQEKINGRTALNQLGELEFRQEGNSAVFKLPMNGAADVQITWICLKDTEADFQSTFTTNSEGFYSIDISKESIGHYDVQININQGDKYYYSSKRFIIQ